MDAERREQRSEPPHDLDDVLKVEIRKMLPIVLLSSEGAMELGVGQENGLLREDSYSRHKGRVTLGP
jgi:hypothetical protein